MIRHQVRRGFAAVAITAMALTIAPAVSAHADDPVGPSETPSSESPEELGVDVRLRVANRDVREVSTTRVWAAKLLADEGVSVDSDDLVKVRRDGREVTKAENRRLRAGDTVRVVKVKVRSTSQRHPIKPRTITRKTTKLKPGARKVVDPGKAGVRKVTRTRTRHNGRLVDVERTTKVVRHAKPRRVLVGQASRTVPGTGHLNWKALANCESGGNPKAVNPAGYYGLYQFNTGTWASVGGSGLPSNASPGEQTYRAQLLYKQRGRQPWPHCGRYL